MKSLRKIMALLIAMTMVIGMSVAVFAADGNGTITVNNAAKGETYAVYKVLSATINSTGGIDYTGEIPSEFESILETKSVGTAPNLYSAVGIKEGVSQDQINAALKAYAVNKENAESYDALVASKTFANADQSKTADGNSVVFDVAPGFYVIVSSQGTNVMANSATNPTTTINEKNTTNVTVDKTVEKESYSIGDTVKYTATFNTANYVDGKPIVHYEISDTLPSFLSNATVTSVTVAGTPLSPTPNFDSNKKFKVEWATWNDTTKKWESKYNNGAQIVVKYEATLTSTTNIGSDDTNTITIKPQLGKDDGTEEEPIEKNWNDDAVIKTYAAAVKKTDGTNGLKGATFSIKGLIAHAGDEAGVWIVDSYNPDSTATPTTLTTDDNGKLYIVGLASGLTLKLQEESAPEGYNKLEGTKDLTPQLVDVTTYKTESWAKYDAKGNLIDSSTTETTDYVKVTKSLADLDAAGLEVVNNAGSTLPSTGGIGTTIFYIIGGILVAGAAILLIAKRKTNA